MYKDVYIDRCEAETVLLSFVRARGSLGFLQVCTYVYKCDIYRLYTDIYRYIYI